MLTKTFPACETPGRKTPGRELYFTGRWLLSGDRRDHLWLWPCGTRLDVEYILLAYASLVPGDFNENDRRSPLTDLCPLGQVCITVGCQQIHYAI